MKKSSVLILALLLTVVCSLPGWTGTLTNNQFLFKPSLGARGATEKNTFDAGLDRVDARLAKEIWVGDPKYGTTFTDAVTAIGATPAILRIPAGTYNITADLTTPATLTLKPARGAILNVADGKTLTINGGFEGGLWPCFSLTGSGKVVFGTAAVKEVYPQWFGAVSGTGNDCSAAFTAAIAALNNYQILRITDGTWRFTSPLTCDKGINIQGVGYGSQLYPDVGASNDAITFGDSSTSHHGLVIRDLTIFGPANSCKNALVLTRMQNLTVNNLVVSTGAAEYAILAQGCIYPNIQFRVMAVNSPNKPWGGIKFVGATGPPLMQNNVVNLNADIEWTGGGSGIYIGDDVQGNYNITGSIEYCIGQYTLFAKNVKFLNIDNLYADDGNTGKIHCESCLQTSIRALKAPNITTEFVGCTNLSLDASEFNDLYIDPACINTKVGNINVIRLHDSGQNTTYVGSVNQRNLTYPTRSNLKAGTGDQQNLISNANFRRWQSDRPDGWGKTGATTWTKCGDGLSDTTRRGTPYCAKSSITADSANSLPLDGDIVKQLLGQSCTLSLWVYHPSGQNPSQYPKFRVRVVDGGVNKDQYSSDTVPLSAATDDTWTKVVLGFNVPATATDVQLSLWQYGTDALYLSEPCLLVNAGAAASYVPSRWEHGDYLTIGGTKITVGTAPPTTGWWNQGDVRFNSAATVGQAKGWQCTVSGTPGTWVSMGNL